MSHNLLAAEFLCNFHDVLCTQTELLEQLGCGAGVTKLIVDADAAMLLKNV